MVSTSRRPAGIHRLLHLFGHVVSAANVPSPPTIPPTPMFSTHGAFNKAAAEKQKNDRSTSTRLRSFIRYVQNIICCYLGKLSQDTFLMCITGYLLFVSSRDFRCIPHVCAQPGLQPPGGFIKCLPANKPVFTETHLLS